MSNKCSHWFIAAACIFAGAASLLAILYSQIGARPANGSSTAMLRSVVSHANRVVLVGADHKHRTDETEALRGLLLQVLAENRRVDVPSKGYLTASMSLEGPESERIYVLLVDQPVISMRGEQFRLTATEWRQLADMLQR